MKKCIIVGLSLLLFVTQVAFCDNQTPSFSPILPEADNLPFTLQIELENFSLPNGIHSGVNGHYKGKWLFLAGRTNGLHDFQGSIPNSNFPRQAQNTNVYVIDFAKKTVAVRSLNDPGSGLSQKQIDLLSVTSPQGYQSGYTLYMTGGYGVDTATNQFSTKDVLTAINIPGLIHWVTHPLSKVTAAGYIRQISDPIFKVTGGYMDRLGKHPTLLVFGQDFQGYYVPESNGNYTQQVRRFNIIDDGVHLKIDKLSSRPALPDPNFRRRDLNVVPVVSRKSGKLVGDLVALAGVFTLTDGVWTVPVKITPTGKTSMNDVASPDTFKQGMNQYDSATLGLFSKQRDNMYIILLGGISVGYFDNGVFTTDSEIPFINQITTVKIDKKNKYQQYIMEAEYPVIISTESNPGNPLLFGASAEFIPAVDMPLFKNGVINLDKLREKPVVVGYIVGGIQSTVPNTSTISDSAASPYIFKVVLARKKSKN